MQTNEKPLKDVKISRYFILPNSTMQLHTICFLCGHFQWSLSW